MSHLSQRSEKPQFGVVKVTEIMTHPVITVTPDTGIKEAARQLVENGISALPVLNASGGLVGIVSEADLLSLEARPDPRSQAAPLPPSAGSTAQTVGEVMTRHVLVVEADTEVAQAARIMIEAGIKRVPVVNERKVIGIVSRRDLIKVIARGDEELKTEIVNRLSDLGMLASPSAVNVADGVVTIQIDDHETGRRLAESVVLGVPGALEVRFTAQTPAPRGRSTKASRRHPPDALRTPCCIGQYTTTVFINAACRLHSR
jgi:CBS domain-containing protein